MKLICQITWSVHQSRASRAPCRRLWPFSPRFLDCFASPETRTRSRANGEFASHFQRDTTRPDSPRLSSVTSPTREAWRCSNLPGYQDAARSSDVDFAQSEVASHTSACWWSSQGRRHSVRRWRKRRFCSDDEIRARTRLSWASSVETGDRERGRTYLKWKCWRYLTKCYCERPKFPHAIR